MRDEEEVKEAFDAQAASADVGFGLGHATFGRLATVTRNITVWVRVFIVTNDKF